MALTTATQEETFSIERELSGLGENLVNAANALAVANQADYDAATEFLKGVKGAARKVNDYFNPDIEAAHKLHRSLTAKRGDFLRPMEQAEATVKGKAIAWLNAERRRVDEENRRAQEAARRAAEEQRLAEAAAMEAQGEHEVAQAMIDAPVVVGPVAVAAEPDKGEGVSVRKSWDCELIDVGALPHATLVAIIGGNDALRRGVEAGLKRLVKAQGGSIPIPGVRIFETANMAVRV